MSMAHSLEVRVPFLDDEVVRTCLAIPLNRLRRGKQGKLPLRRLLADDLSPCIVKRKKAGFLVPLERWMRSGAGKALCPRSVDGDVRRGERPRSLGNAQADARRAGERTGRLGLPAVRPVHARGLESDLDRPQPTAATGSPGERCGQLRIERLGPWKGDMKRALASPYFWIVVAAAIAFGFHALSGGFQVREALDTPSYRDFDASSLTSALSEIRTFGYPLFLKSLNAIGIGEAGAPYVHFVVSILAAIGFCAGLRVAGFGVPAAAAASCSLLFVYAVRSSTPECFPTRSPCRWPSRRRAFFVAVSPKGGWLAFSALGPLTFLTYQFRPAYLFLIPLWPALALLLESFLTGPGRSAAAPGRQTRALSRGDGSSVSALLRPAGATVGHFGLVSFGGYNVVGIAAQFLDAPLAREMPSDLRPLAEEIYDADRACKGSRRRPISMRWRVPTTRRSGLSSCPWRESSPRGTTSKSTLACRGSPGRCCSGDRKRTPGGSSGTANTPFDSACRSPSATARRSWRSRRFSECTASGSFEDDPIRRKEGSTPAANGSPAVGSRIT